MEGITEAVAYHQCVSVYPKNNIVGARFLGDRFHQPNGTFHRTSISASKEIAEADCANAGIFTPIDDKVADMRLRSVVGKEHVDNGSITGAENRLKHIQCDVAVSLINESHDREAHLSARVLHNPTSPRSGGEFFVVCSLNSFDPTFPAIRAGSRSSSLF
jgi:hypothetical protein